MVSPCNIVFVYGDFQFSVFLFEKFSSVRCLRRCLLTWLRSGFVRSHAMGCWSRRKGEGIELNWWMKKPLLVLVYSGCRTSVDYTTLHCTIYCTRYSNVLYNTVQGTVGRGKWEITKNNTWSGTVYRIMYQVIENEMTHDHDTSPEFFKFLLYYDLEFIWNRSFKPEEPWVPSTDVPSYTMVMVKRTKLHSRYWAVCAWTVHR